MRFGIYVFGDTEKLPMNEKVDPVKIVRVFSIDSHQRLHLDIDENGSGIELDMDNEEIVKLRDLLTAQIEEKPYPPANVIKFVRGVD